VDGHVDWGPRAAASEILPNHKIINTFLCRISKAKLVRHSLEVLLRSVRLVHQLWHFSKLQNIFPQFFLDAAARFQGAAEENGMTEAGVQKFEFLGPGCPDRSPKLDPGGRIIRVENVFRSENGFFLENGLEMDFFLNILDSN